jgi:hypothetical protein
MKKFAFFLPQFHEIPENDKWWGKGFTEWVNVKNAKPLYKGHKQPKIPLNNNYYNLLDKSTVEWQTNLLHEFKIDGLIYYHYYFNGYKLLEKPAENLLQWKDINQPFFFCWANHPWQRTWEGSNKVLMAMNYGTKDDWEKHFQYLLPFFKDHRYEKKDNMPLFMIFKSNDPILNDIFLYFNQRCKDYGFNGICLIESYHGVDYPNDFHPKGIYDNTKYVYIREPAFSNSYYRKIIKKTPEKVIRAVQNRMVKYHLSHKPQLFDGDKMYEIKLKYEPKGNNIIHGLCFEWDNTPRHHERGYVITPVSKTMFTNYIKSIADEEYLFIDAWNEWAEGMILEPTEEDGYKYLEWIKEIS